MAPRGRRLHAVLDAVLADTVQLSQWTATVAKIELGMEDDLTPMGLREAERAALITAAGLVIQLYRIVEIVDSSPTTRSLVAWVAACLAAKIQDMEVGPCDSGG